MPVTRRSVLAVFKRSGTSGLIHLIGDWSVVIDDRSHGSVILASDFAGVRPPGVSDLDERYVAAYFMFGECPK